MINMSSIREIYFNNSDATTSQRILFKGGSYNNILMDITFMLTNCGTVAIAPNTSKGYGTHTFILCSYGNPSNTTKN